ncbi:hypothetical protein JHK85_007329 [Glycine max]|nr:hypothetical protein JHK85_007329 [Glycine max]KAG5071908.1 hypothetical protein JHK86_007119 [Glycine max]
MHAFFYTTCIKTRLIDSRDFGLTFNFRCSKTRFHIEFRHQHHDSIGKNCLRCVLVSDFHISSSWSKIYRARELDSCAGNYYQIMSVPNSSCFELTNLFAKILNQRQNIHEKEEQGDDEKGKLVSLGQMNSLSSKQDVPMLDLVRAMCSVHDEKSGQPLAFEYTLNTIMHFVLVVCSEVKEDSRTSKNISSEGERRTPEIMGRCASWWATFTFFVCLCSLKFSKPLLQPQGPNSLWLAILGMFSFTVFVSAASVMVVVEAQFTRMQITVMLSAFLALLLA